MAFEQDEIPCKGCSNDVKICLYFGFAQLLPYLMMVIEMIEKTVYEVGLVSDMEKVELRDTDTDITIMVTGSNYHWFVSRGMSDRDIFTYGISIGSPTAKINSQVMKKKNSLPKIFNISECQKCGSLAFCIIHNINGHHNPEVLKEPCRAMPQEPDFGFV